MGSHNEQVTSISNLCDRIYTILTTSEGWTADHFDGSTGEWALSKDDGAGQSVEVAFQWDDDDVNASVIGVY